MFKVNNKDTCSSVSIVNFEHVIAGWNIDEKEYEPKNMELCGTLAVRMIHGQIFPLSDI